MNPYLGFRPAGMQVSGRERSDEKLLNRPTTEQPMRTIQ
jgi:hypothetical protein